MKFLTLAAVLGLANTGLAHWHQAYNKHIEYSAVTGYFLQDDSATDASTFDYTEQNFGLLNRTYPTDSSYDPHGRKTQWERFARWVKYLSRKCQKDNKARYKVLVMGRHGEGFHNAAESYFGTPAWNCYWSELDGNATTTWADAKLTPAGYEEAYKANSYFQSSFEEEGMPYFQSYYSSPLTRCTTTANVTFANLTLPRSRPFGPVIKEFFREGISMHTCDRRSDKSDIAKLVPNFSFEDDFTEKDELWRGTAAETSEHQLFRSRAVLDDVFRHDEATWISVTSHSGEIRSLLEVLGHREFSLSTGQIIPVLVEAKIVDGEHVPPKGPGFTAEKTCDAPPVTSIEGAGCVCTSVPVTSITITTTTGAPTPTTTEPAECSDE